LWEFPIESAEILHRVFRGVGLAVEVQVVPRSGPEP
jgi:hypothetical protein